METIDAKDLCVGSYVLDEWGETGEVATLGVGAFDMPYISIRQPGKMSTFLCNKPRTISITPEWLIKLGGHDLSASLERTCYGFVPVADGPMPPDIIHVEPFENLWVLAYDGYVIKVLNGIHHLQQLVWTLERVWLTIQPQQS